MPSSRGSKSRKFSQFELPSTRNEDVALPNQESADSNRPIYETPHLKDIEKSIDVYVMSLYRMDSRDYRNYRQRSILVTLKSRSAVENRIQDLADQITQKEQPDEDFETELLSDREFIALGRKTRPQDSTIVSIESPLVMAKRSPKTGSIFYNDEFDYCPETSAKLRYVIAKAQNTT